VSADLMGSCRNQGDMLGRAWLFYDYRPLGLQASRLVFELRDLLFQTRLSHHDGVRLFLTVGVGHRPAGNRPDGMSADADPTYSMTVKARLRRAGKGKRLVVGGTVAGKPNAPLISLIARALVIKEQLLSGSDDSLEAITRRLRTTRGHPSSLVRLSYLSPEIIRSILNGDLTATKLLPAAKSLPMDWAEQRKTLGFVRT